MKREMEYLKRHYGSHEAVADALGIKPRTWRGYRSGEIPIPPWMQQLIKDRTELLQIKDRLNSAA